MNFNNIDFYLVICQADLVETRQSFAFSESCIYVRVDQLLLASFIFVSPSNDSYKSDTQVQLLLLFKVCF